jgi:hypothetical protein
VSVRKRNIWCSLPSPLLPFAPDMTCVIKCFSDLKTLLSNGTCYVELEIGISVSQSVVSLSRTGNMPVAYVGSNTLINRVGERKA